jgi:hypothetical protein
MNCWQRVPPAGKLRAMFPVEVAAPEARQFELLVRRSGGDPASFRLRKVAREDGSAYRMRVMGRGAATVYDAKQPGEWTKQFVADLESGVFGIKGPPPLEAPVGQLLASFERELQAHGLEAAISLLNARVPHRFTGVYRRETEVMRNVAIVDKHPQLDPVDLSVVPMQHSFCQFVLRDSIFVTNDSGRDERLAGHPYSGVVGCYVGVPISRGAGTLDGTLCHFDLVDHPIADDEFLLMQRAAGLLSGFI